MEKKMIELKKDKPKNPPSSEKALASKKLDKIELHPKEPSDMAEHTEEAVELTSFKEQLIAELKAEGLLDEAVLNLQQRIKRRSIMRAHKVMYAKARQRAEKRMATPQRLQTRAQAQARQAARNRFAGQRGVKYHELGPSDKIAVDKLIDKKGALIKKIAARLLPVVRKKEIQRLASFRSGEAMKPEHTPAAVVREETALVSFSEMQQQSKKRGRPASPETLAKRAAKAKTIDKDDDEYGPDNGREADQNIIVQLKKAISMNGKKDVEFDSGNPVMIKPTQAQKALDHYMGLKKPAEKLEYMKKISTSFADFKKMIGEENDNTELLSMIESVMNRIEENYISEEAVEGLKKKSQKSGVPLSILKKVYNRGMAAWKTGHRPGTTPQQWAFARVNSYITKGKGTYYGADKDLHEAEMAASTKKAREAHFNKMSKKSDSDPSAYVPAPGDATAKTKLSVHTRKYREMFGEEVADEACWSGYKQIGLKDKNGKKVPNCVPIKESGGEVVFKSGKNHIEKYSDDSYAVYKDGVKKFFYNTLADAKSSLNEAMTPQEKFKAGLKKSGYDPDAGAKRLTDLLAKQKKEREEHEKKYGHLYAKEEVELDEAGPFSYGAKPARKGSIAYNAAMKRKEQEKGKQPVEPKDQMVGIAKVAKEDLQLEQAPVAPALIKHRIAVTVSEPDHTMVTKRKEQVLKHVIIPHGSNKESAQKLGEKFYKNRGYKVHGSEHVGIKEGVNESDNKTQYAIKHKMSKKILSTHKDLASAKDEWKGIDKDERPFYQVVSHTKPAKSFSMKEEEESNKKYWAKTGKTAKHNETGEKTHEYAEYDNKDGGQPTGKREYRNAQGKPMGESLEKTVKLNISEDAASHLRVAAALQAKGKPQLAAFHKKIASALQRGDKVSAQRFSQQLRDARARTQPVKEGINDPAVKNFMSLKEMLAKSGAYAAKNPENDPEDQVFVGSYRSQHFEASPEAQKLYTNLPKDTNPNTASVSAAEHDKLLHLYKKVILSKFATPEDLAAAKSSAAKIMKLADEMNLSSEHGYINGIIRNISDAASAAIDRTPPSDNLANDPRFKTLPKDLNQEPGPSNDKDVDNLKNYLITRNIKAQRKLKIIDND